MTDRLKIFLVALFLLTVVMAACGYIGYRAASDKYEKILADSNAAEAEKLAELTGKVAEAERKLRDELSAKDAQLIKEKNNAQKTIDALRADVRSGALRLYAVSNATCGSADGADTAAQFGEARTELDPAFAESLITIAADGDEAIRELNHCIDAYDSVRAAVNE